MIKSENQLFIGILLLGLILGYVSNGLASNYFQAEYEIVYISQNELLQLEQERMQALAIDKQQLFLGNLPKALELIQIIASNYESPTSRVVFTDTKVSGSNVRSISKEVHEALLMELSS